MIHRSPIAAALFALLIAACGKPNADADAGGAALTVSPGSQDFGGIALGSSGDPVEFTVTNTGTETVGPLSTSVAGTDAVDFEVASDQCVNANLDSGQSCTFSVVFAPMSSGVKSATANADGGNAQASASLSGEGLANRDLVVDLGELTFDTTELNTVSTAQTITVTNTGLATTGALIAALDDDTDFTITEDNCGTQTLGTNQSCTVSVAMSPGTIGDKSAALSVVGDPGGTTTTTVSGVGAARVTVNFGGNGTGTITSNPPGIVCPDTACSALFNAPSVTLSASPDATQTFEGWAGEGCSGTGTCVVTTEQSRAVTANLSAPDKVIFISSTTHDGNMGGILTMDAHCQSLAAMAGLPGTFKAWLSDDTVAARDRMFQSTGDYVRTDGVVVANGFADLTDADGVLDKIDNPINKTETGGTPPASGGCGTTRSVWTGTFPTGTAATQNCGNWTTTANGINGMQGDPDDTDKWSFTCTISNCQGAHPIYCVEQ